MVVVHEVILGYERVDLTVLVLVIVDTLTSVMVTWYDGRKVREPPALSVTSDKVTREELGCPVHVETPKTLTFLTIKKSIAIVLVGGAVTFTTTSTDAVIPMIKLSKKRISLLFVIFISLLSVLF